MTESVADPFKDSALRAEAHRGSSPAAVAATASSASAAAAAASAASVSVHTLRSVFEPTELAPPKRPAGSTWVTSAGTEALRPLPAQRPPAQPPAPQEAARLKPSGGPPQALPSSAPAFTSHTPSAIRPPQLSVIREGDLRPSGENLARPNKGYMEPAAVSRPKPGLNPNPRSKTKANSNPDPYLNPSLSAIPHLSLNTNLKPASASADAPGVNGGSHGYKDFFFDGLPQAQKGHLADAGPASAADQQQQQGGVRLPVRDLEAPTSLYDVIISSSTDGEELAGVEAGAELGPGTPPPHGHLYIESSSQLWSRWRAAGSMQDYTRVAEDARGEEDEEEEEHFGGPILTHPGGRGGGNWLREPLLPRGQRRARRERLSSLDVFRGIAIVGMMVVDDAGGYFPAINHAPWFGISAADYVMPFFLFIVGVSTALSFKRIPSTGAALGKVAGRSLKLFVLGLFLQGGYYHGESSLTFGVTVTHLRIFGILQRIAVAYLVVALCEVAVAKSHRHRPAGGFLGLLTTFMLHWGVAALIAFFYLGFTYMLKVPDWEFTPPPQPSPVAAATTAMSAAASQLASALQLGRQLAATNVTTWKVTCGVAGELSPACNAAGYLDRTILGIRHMYQHPAYQRTLECSVNAPDYGPLPDGAPSWCLAPFDPEGLLSTLPAILSAFAGLHYGHILTHFKRHSARVTLGAITATLLVLVGLGLQYPWVLKIHRWFPDLPSWPIFQYPGLLSLIYVLVDVLHVRFYTRLFEWAGLNPLLIFVLGASGVLEALLRGFYVGTPDNNLVTLVAGFFRHVFPREDLAALCAVITKCIGWCLAGGFLAHQGHTWKF
eukprot:jgi/Mesen1/10173/ME000076S09678